MIEPIQLHELHLPKLSPKARFRRASEIADRSGLQSAMEACLTCSRGRPRAFSARALLILLVLHGLRRKKMHLTKVMAITDHLSRSQRRQLGLSDDYLGAEQAKGTYRQIWYAFTCLAKALETGSFGIPHNHEIKHDLRFPRVADLLITCRDGSDGRDDPDGWHDEVPGRVA